MRAASSVARRVSSTAGVPARQPLRAVLQGAASSGALPARWVQARSLGSYPSAPLRIARHLPVAFSPGARAYSTASSNKIWDFNQVCRCVLALLARLWFSMAAANQAYSSKN